MDRGDHHGKRKKKTWTENQRIKKVIRKDGRHFEDRTSRREKVVRKKRISPEELKKITKTGRLSVRIRTFPMMSWSCPFHAFQLPLQVPDIFSVCPLHFPCVSRSLRVISLHLPSCRLVSLCFVSPPPLIPPALPLFSFLSLACPFQFRLLSLSFPAAFLSCRLPISSPHFLAVPCISPLLPKNMVFPAFS